MFVVQGHVAVNGRRVTIPSYSVRPGEMVSVKPESQKLTSVLAAVEEVQRRGIPDWLEVDRENFSGKIKVLPTRADIAASINEKLIVELYSK